MIVFERVKNGFAILCNSSEIEEAHRNGEIIVKYNDGELIEILKPEEDIPEDFIEPFSIRIKPGKEGEANG